MVAANKGDLAEIRRELMSGVHGDFVAERREMFSRVTRIAFWAVLAHIVVLLVLAATFA